MNAQSGWEWSKYLFIYKLQSPAWVYLFYVTIPWHSIVTCPCSNVMRIKNWVRTEQIPVFFINVYMGKVCKHFPDYNICWLVDWRSWNLWTFIFNLFTVWTKQKNKSSAKYALCSHFKHSELIVSYYNLCNYKYTLQINTSRSLDTCMGTSLLVHHPGTPLGSQASMPWKSLQSTALDTTRTDL